MFLSLICTHNVYNFNQILKHDIKFGFIFGLAFGISCPLGKLKKKNKAFKPSTCKPLQTESRLLNELLLSGIHSWSRFLSTKSSSWKITFTSQASSHFSYQLSLKFVTALECLVDGHHNLMQSKTRMPFFQAETLQSVLFLWVYRPLKLTWNCVCNPVKCEFYFKLMGYEFYIFCDVFQSETK